ncbi:MAG: hypothetical protein BMS9Abin07_1625 [Acidimicrobiia bacterium]|nr:MAG: hypothetical protein BMS9Abin07_1625 [Acidimicrobiia bacterium]
MTAALAIALAVAVTYAVNTWKIRLVTKGKALAAASMEATQAFLYLYVLMEILQSADTALGIGAYVAGAFLGTIAAMLVARRQTGPLVPHHHDCCPPPGAPGVSPVMPQQADHAHSAESATGRRPLSGSPTTEYAGSTRREKP